MHDSKAHSVLGVSAHDSTYSFPVGDVSDGLWHFVCTSWQAASGNARLSVDAKASCSTDAGPNKGDQDAAFYP